LSGKAGGLPRRPPLSTARAAFTASQPKQARRRLPDTSDIATASGVKTAPRSSLTTTTVPLSLKPRYTQAAGITASISPHTLRHFLFTWLKTQGIDDALIQPYSGHATRQSLEIYSRIALADAQQRYDDAIGDFPV
jgi:integrase